MPILLSRPVLLGYQAGLAIIVISAQLPHLLGIDAGGGSTLGTVVDVARALDRSNAPTIVLSGLCIIGMALLNRRRPSWPSAVIVVAASTLGVATLGLTDTVDVVGNLPSGLPQVRLPGLSLEDVASLLVPAVAIALVAAADTLVTARAFAARNAEEIDANRDLLGLGAANVASAVSGGITTSASMARTAVAESVGSHSQVSGLAAAATMLLVLLFLTGPLSQVPRAALASVVVLAVGRLIEVTHVRRLWAIRRTECAIAVGTFASVVIAGVLPALVVAIVLSLVDAMGRAIAPNQRRPRLAARQPVHAEDASRRQGDGGDQPDRQQDGTEPVPSRRGRSVAPAWDASRTLHGGSAHRILLRFVGPASPATDRHEESKVPASRGRPALPGGRRRDHAVRKLTVGQIRRLERNGGDLR